MAKGKRPSTKRQPSKRKSQTSKRAGAVGKFRIVGFEDLKANEESSHHDVFVTTPPTKSQRASRIYRFVVNKENGEYDAVPFALSADGSDTEQCGERKLRGLVEQDSRSGVAFATLPVKEEPTAVAGSCYLINRQLLNYNTVWTRAPWNDSPNDLENKHRYTQATVSEDAPNPTPRFLLALNNGEVLDIQVTRGANHAPKMQPTVLDLHANPDVWRLLRNGCVAGVAKHADRTMLPLFSLASVHTRPFDKRRKHTTHITGTLDYKWRPGSTIKVKFTGYDTERDYGRKRAEVIAEIEKLAQGWVKGVNLRLDFDGGKVDPVRDDYDMLVSLEPLVKLDARARTQLPSGAPRPGEGPAEPVRFPKSLLGCYAEREERNVATMFLGYPGNLHDPFDPTGKVIEALDYLGSRVFKHIVLHEFGHALGLPHLYQHPGLARRPFAKLSGTNRAIANRLKGRVGPAFDEAYVEHELRGRWPSAQYSEWPTIKAGKSDREVLLGWLATSVMVGIPARALLTTGDEVLPLRDSLGPTDLRWIKQLYPR